MTTMPNIVPADELVADPEVERHRVRRRRAADTWRAKDRLKVRRETARVKAEAFLRWLEER